MIFLKRFNQYISRSYNLIIDDDEFGAYPLTAGGYSTDYFAINGRDYGYAIYNNSNEIIIKFYTEDPREQGILINKFTNNIDHLWMEYINGKRLAFDYIERSRFGYPVYAIGIDIKDQLSYIRNEYHKKIIHGEWKIRFYMKNLDFRVKLNG